MKKILRILVARCLLVVGLFLSVCHSEFVHANELNIIFVRKNIPMSDEDPSYRDLYLNIGASQGAKKDQTYTVFRKMQVRDASGSLSFGEIEIPIGEIKVLAAYERVSVARDSKIYSREAYPTLEIFGTMAGDRIELKK